jgi:hypothetical protein
MNHAWQIAYGYPAPKTNASAWRRASIAIEKSAVKQRRFI